VANLLKIGFSVHSFWKRGEEDTLALLPSFGKQRDSASSKAGFLLSEAGTGLFFYHSC
jgi:hypothetical protein